MYIYGVCMYVYMCVYVCVFMVYICMYIYIYVSIYMYGAGVETPGGGGGGPRATAPASRPSRPTSCGKSSLSNVNSYELTFETKGFKTMVIPPSNP